MFTVCATGSQGYRRVRTYVPISTYVIREGSSRSHRRDSDFEPFMLKVQFNQLLVLTRTLQILIGRNHATRTTYVRTYVRTYVCTTHVCQMLFRPSLYPTSNAFGYNVDRCVVDVFQVMCPPKQLVTYTELRCICVMLTRMDLALVNTACVLACK